MCLLLLLLIYPVFYVQACVRILYSEKNIKVTPFYFTFTLLEWYDGALGANECQVFDKLKEITHTKHTYKKLFYTLLAILPFTSSSSSWSSTYQDLDGDVMMMLFCIHLLNIIQDDHVDDNATLIMKKTDTHSHFFQTCSYSFTHTQTTSSITQSLKIF